MNKAIIYYSLGGNTKGAAEKIQNMTMREIRDLIDELSTYSDTGESSEDNKESGGHGAGNRFGHEQGNGRGASRSER